VETLSNVAPWTEGMEVRLCPNALRDMIHERQARPSFRYDLSSNPTEREK
jgi:hypothetical protein